MKTNMKTRDFIYIIIIALLSICLGLSVRSCSETKQDYTHNVAAMIDTIEYYKGKNDEVVAEKMLLQGDIDILKVANNELNEIIKSMKVKDPQQIVCVETVIENEIKDTVFICEPYDSIYNFNFDNQWRELNGSINISDNTMNMSIYKDVVNIDFSLAIDDEKVFITSDNPYIKYKDITGYTIPKQKQKRWGFGPYAGVGYNFSSQKFEPSFGFSISWHLFEW